MSDSQNKKNEQQNNLCTTLTEQWKKGELERGRYYIKYRGNYMSDNWHGDCWEDSWSDYVEEVLAPVPSYEEWRQLIKFLEEFNALDVAKENKELKELLKECRETIDDAWMYCGIATPDAEAILTKIDNAIGEKK
jgi:hypothetical protein